MEDCGYCFPAKELGSLLVLLDCKILLNCKIHCHSNDSVAAFRQVGTDSTNFVKFTLTPITSDHSELLVQVNVL